MREKRNIDIGTLYVIATPIGNLQDITFRAIETLKKVDYILAEDTRHSRTLLNNYHITTPVFPLHEHNERAQTPRWLDQLIAGQSIALLSDAGTPLIHDPGYFIVKTAKENGITVSPIPGPCAAIAALSAAGLPTDRFIFEGFLAPSTQKRQTQLKALLRETRTMILYEAPHRILECIRDLHTVFGPARQIVLARELTKRFETIRAGSIAELYTWLIETPEQQRGEMVLLIEGHSPIESDEDDHTLESLLTILLSSVSLSQAVDIATKITKQRKKKIYTRALSLQAQQSSDITHD